MVRWILTWAVAYFSRAALNEADDTYSSTRGLSLKAAGGAALDQVTRPDRRFKAETM